MFVTERERESAYVCISERECANSFVKNTLHNLLLEYLLLPDINSFSPSNGSPHNILELYSDSFVGYPISGSGKEEPIEGSWTPEPTLIIRSVIHGRRRIDNKK